MTIKKNNILVSIVIPVYGVEKYIERCAVSLFEQTYDNIEYIFVDDCTPDASITKMEAVLARYPNRKAGVNVVKNISNRGLAAVRNIGVEHCRGQFLLHVDSDDWIDTDVVELCVKEQQINDSDIVLFDRKIYRNEDVQMIPAKDVESKESFLVQMLMREREISIWGMLIRTSLYIDNGIECVDGVNMSEDYQTSPRLAYYANKIVVAHGVYYNYECRNMKSISATFTEKNVKQELVTLKVLTSFFNNKEEIYKQTSDYGVAKQLCYFRHNAAYFKMSRLKNEIEAKIKSINRNILSTLPLPYRIGLHIENSELLRLYVRILKSLKRINNR